MATTLFVKRFWTKYKPNPKDPGEMIGVDWVEYGPLGGLDRTLTSAPVHTLISQLQPLEDNQNPSVVMAHERGNIIRQKYEAWKQGREVPVNGTPLSAWNALNAEQVEIMIRVGIRSVEDVAALTDSSSARLAIPNRNELIRQAKNFLDAKEQSRLAAKLGEKDHEIDILRANDEDNKAQIAEMRKQIEQLAALMLEKQEAEESAEMEDAAGDAAPVRRGPGRPPKNPQPQAAA